MVSIANAFLFVGIIGAGVGQRTPIKLITPKNLRYGFKLGYSGSGSIWIWKCLFGIPI